MAEISVEPSARLLLYDRAVQKRLLRLCALLLLMALALARCGTARPSAEAATSARLDALFTDLHARGLFDGAVVVGNDQSILWEKGFGYADVEARAPFTPDTPTDGASLAKTFTAALLLMLQQEGRLSLDEPAQRLLPELPYSAISLRDLLSHSAGLPDYTYFDQFMAADAIRTTETLLGVLSRHKPQLHFTPGTEFEYSSLGYDFAALAASRAAGEPYGNLLERRFFGPLGIGSVFLRPARLSDFPGIRTRGYVRKGGELRPNEVFDFEAFHGGSNIYISARDLHRWSASWLRGSLLGPVALAESLRAARIGDAASGLTLGSWYGGRDGSAWWYSGHLQGFHSEAFRDVGTRRSIVYTSNNTLAAWLQHGIIRAVNAILDGGDPGPLAPPSVREIPKGEYEALAGVWKFDEGVEYSVSLTDGRLFIAAQGVRYQMFQTAPQFFYVPGLDFVVALSDGSSPERMYLSTNLAQRWGRRSTS